MAQPSDVDFPIRGKSDHPGKVAVFKDIDDCRDEFLSADEATPRTTLEGRVLRSKKEIVTHLLLLLNERGGRFKEKKNGQWVPLQCKIGSTCSFGGDESPPCTRCEQVWKKKMRDQIVARIRAKSGGATVRQAVASHLEDERAPISPIRSTNIHEPSSLSVTRMEDTYCRTLDTDDFSSLFSDMSVTAKSQQPDMVASAAIPPESGTVGAASASVISGEPLTLMSTSEPPTVSQVDSQFARPPSTDLSQVSRISLIIGGFEDASTSKESTDAVENIMDKLYRMKEHNDDVLLIAEHTDALAGETYMYYRGEGSDDEEDEPDRKHRYRRPAGNVNAEAVVLLLEAVEAHPTELPIQRNCCLILSNLAQSRDNAGAIGSAGCVWLVGAMQRAPNNNEEIQRIGSYGLSNLALNDSNRMAVCDCGGISALIRAMDGNPNEEKLQRCASKALGNLARGKKGENREKIKNEGGIEMLVAAMKRFPNSPVLQRSCLRAFANLAKEDNVRAAILEADGINLVVTAMKKFTSQDDGELQESGCHALGNLSMSKDCTVAIVDLGGVPCIADAMQTFPNNEELQRYGCFAFFYMTRVSFEKVQGEGNVDTISRAVKIAVEAFPSSSGKYGKKTLKNMAQYSPTSYVW